MRNWAGRRRRQTLVRAGVFVVVGVALVAVYQYVIAPTGGMAVGCYMSATDTAQPRDSRLTKTACDSVHRLEMIGYIDAENDMDQCRTLAEEFVGGTLAETRVVTVLLKSSVDGLYPCAVAESGDIAGHLISRSATMRAARGTLMITCLSHEGENNWRYTGCTGPHTGELLGVVADGGEPEASCKAAADSYVGKGFDARDDLDLLWADAAEQHVACYAADKRDDNTLHASIKGLGAAPLPH